MIGGLRFNLIDLQTSNRIRMIAQDAENGQELQRRELAKGYEFWNNRYVLLTDADFDRTMVDSSSVMASAKLTRGTTERQRRTAIVETALLIALIAIEAAWLWRLVYVLWHLW